MSVEAGILEMLTRMQTGRFKVFRDPNGWFEEFRIYHAGDRRSTGRAGTKSKLGCAPRRD